MGNSLIAEVAAAQRTSRIDARSPYSIGTSLIALRCKKPLRHRHFWPITRYDERHNDPCYNPGAPTPTGERSVISVLEKTILRPPISGILGGGVGGILVPIDPRPCCGGARAET